MNNRKSPTRGTPGEKYYFTWTKKAVDVTLNIYIYNNMVLNTMNFAMNSTIIRVYQVLLQFVVRRALSSYIISLFFVVI